MTTLQSIQQVRLWRAVRAGISFNAHEARGWNIAVHRSSVDDVGDREGAALESSAALACLFIVSEARAVIPKFRLHIFGV
jgi:hypothetical protein